MKKFVLCAAVAAVMLFSACSADVLNPKPDIDKCFTAKAQIAAGGEVIAGELSRTAENCWVLSVTEPFALEGMTVTLNGGETSFSFLGYECKADFSENTSSLLKIFAETYEAAADNISAYENGVLEGMSESGEYSVMFGENGVPETITAGGISVKLSEWREGTENTGDNGELIMLE